MQELLRRELGIDAFALDGDATELGEEWIDRRRPGPERRVISAS